MHIRKFKLALALSIVLILITIYSHSADYGRPAGLIKIEIQPGQETLTSNPFDAFTPTLNFLFSGQLTGAAIPESADQIRIWDSSIQDFRSAFLADLTGVPDRDGKWFKDNISWESADIILSGGIGFFIKNNQAMRQTIFISGKIPLDDSRSLTLQPNMNLISYPFASKILLNNSDLKNDGSKGGLNINDSPDHIITASPETEHWLMDNAENQESGKWHDESGEISSLELKPGSGYWYERQSISSFQWSENRPYLNPFNADPCTPSIAGMTLNPSHDGFILDIDCTGEPGELLEIFFKDIGANDPLVTECGWSLADQNIPTSGKNRIVWTDAGSSNSGHPFADRARINSVFMRIYIVSRQDIDSDNDGISNGRERFVYDTNPDEPDTDGDGIPDDDEVNAYHTNPNSVDSDNDGYSDSNEISIFHTNPNDPQDNPSVMPAIWKYADIGAMPSTVSAKYFNGTYTVKGAGSDIYGTSDRFNFLYRELTGNFEMTVRIISQQNTNTLAKAGIMIRESIAANSRNAFAFISPGTGGNENCYYQERASIGGATARSGVYASSSAYPYWLKLVKSGNNYSSYRSSNGTAWTAMYTNRIVSMGDSIKVGLAVNSMSNSIPSETVFDNVAFILIDSPSITPNGGYFQLSRQVTLSSPVADSNIRYTTDGSMPTEASPLYTSPFTIDANRTVKARIFKTGYNPGPAATAIFNQPGLMVKYFSGAWTTLPDFSKLDPYKVSMIPKLDYPDNYGQIMTSDRSDNVGAVISGQINCPVQGAYTFYLSSGEGSALYIDGNRIMNSPGLRTYAQSVSPPISLAAGLHDIKVEYFEATGSGGIQLKWSYPGQPASIIPPDKFSSRDIDADGLPDQWEICKFGNLNHTGKEDTDNDGISDKEELNLYFSDPSDPARPFAELALPDLAKQLGVSYCAKNNRTWSYVPDLDKLPRYFTGDGLQPQIKYASGTGAFASSGVKTNVAAQFFGFIDIPTDGLYIFYLSSDDGANLYIDNNKIIDNDGSHIMREAYGYVSLRAGKHEIKVNYYQTTSTSGLILSYEGPGVPKQVVPESAFFHSPLILSKMMENKDSDSDGLSDTYEKDNALNPGLWDSDSDTISDGDEFTVQNGGSAKGILPEGWKDADVGGALAGSGKHDDADGIFTVKGAGVLSPSTISEKMNFCYQELSGDCEIIARVKTQPNINPWAKAGIMIRKNLNSNCQYSFVYLTPNNGINYVQRAADATASGANLAGGPATAPYWLKLVKKGKTYTPFKSLDGTFWIQVGTMPQTVDMGDIVNVGFAVTSMRDNIPCPVDFDNFSISRILTEKPDISPNGGYFQTSREITFKVKDTKAQIRYTLDNTEPTETSILYTSPFNITASCTVKARTFKEGYKPGPISVAVFNQPGLMVKYYAGNWTTMPDFTKLNPYMTSMIPNIDYPENYGHIMTSGLCDNVGAQITGQLNCPIQGTYIFYLSSSEGAAVYIDGKRIIYSPKTRTFAQTASAAQTLAAGFHDIMVEYFEASGAGGIQLKWSYPGQASIIIPKERFFSEDSDADGLPDQWETHRFGNLDHAGTEDTDGDGFLDRDELNIYFSDPYDPSNPLSATDNENISSGIAVTYCAKNKRTWLSVPEFDRLPHYVADTAKQINYPMTSAKFATSGISTNLAAQFTGFIDIPHDGFYKFYLSSDDGANLYIDNTKIVDNDGLHTMRETYGFASLKSGKHRIRVDYYQTTSYSGLILSYEGSGVPKQIVPASALFHSPKYLIDMINTNDPDSDGVNTITASAGANGSINPCGEVKLEYGANQDFSITPNTNYRVSDVLVDGISAGSLTSYRFTSVKTPHTITANFALNTHAVTFDLAEKGTRVGGGELNQTVMHQNGAIVPTVNANEGWFFTGWDKPFDNIKSDLTVIAQYSRITHTVTFTEGSNGTITGLRVQKVNHGDSCEPVTATPSPGYNFANWTGDLESIENPLKVSNVQSDMSIIANFAIDTQNSVIGSLFGMGFNDEDGELGDGTNTSQNSPVLIVKSAVTAISAGDYHNLFLVNDGSLWTMGYNSDGQLGDGTTVSHGAPIKIVTSGVTAISAGGYHSLFLKDDGSLWAMGYNSYGQLGDGTTSQQSSPVLIVPTGVSAISAGYYHSLFLKDDGSLWAMGNNNKGQLGNGSTISQSSPIQIVSSGVVAISAGGYHSLFIKDDGSLWAMGRNNYGQLGDRSYISQSAPIQILPSGASVISAGYYHSMFTKDDGSLWGMGCNDDGQLGDGTSTSKSSPVQIAPSEVVSISTGDAHSLFIKKDGSLFAMGYNDDGELGDGTFSSKSTPVQIMPSGVAAISAGASHSLFLKTVFTVIFNEGENGSLNGTKLQEVNYGKNCSLVSAVPSPGYHFVDWVKDGVPYSTNIVLVVTQVSEDMSFTANFASNSNPIYSVNFISGENGGIAGNTSQSIYSGESGTAVTAMPSEGWHFYNWTGTGEFTTSWENPLTVSNVKSDMTITANFASNSDPKHTVNFMAGDNGSILGTVSQSIYSGGKGTPVTAIPSAGWHFVNWTGTGDFITTKDNPLSVANVSADMTITANFASNSNPLYMLSFIVKENGYISGTPTQRIYSGESSTPVTAVPSGGYHFVNWTGTGGFAATTDNPLTVTNVTADMTIKANFAIYHLFIPENPLKINEGETSSCSISLLEAPLNDLNVTVSFDSGYNGINLLSPSQLTFTKANWNLPQTIQFSCANDNDADSKTATFKLSGLCETSKLYLMENEKDIIISVNADNNGSVSPSGRISKRIGDAFTVTATPDTNFLFDHWEGGVPEDKIHANPLELIIDTPCAITAVFSNNYRALLKVNDVPSEWMTVTPKINGGWESDISLYGGIANEETYFDDLDLKVYLDDTQTSNISDGFESGTISNWTFALENEGVISVVNAPAFAGNKSLKIAGALGGAQEIYYPASAADKDSKLGFHVYLPPALNEGDIPSAVCYNGVCVSFCYQENGNYSVLLGGSMSGTVTHTDIAASKWNYIELDFDHFADTDFDGMDDDWEIRNFGDLSQDGNSDYDHDGISNLQEFLSGKDPKNPGPKVFFPTAFTKVNKSAGAVNIEVKIDPAPQKFPISAQIHLLDSTAGNGEDINFTSPQTVIFGIGETTKTVPVAVISGEPTGAPEKFALFGLTPQRGIGSGIYESFILYINEIAEDTDNDGLPDWWEMKYFGNLNQGPDGDPDGDGVTNLIEYKQGRHPNAGAKPDRTNKLKLEVSF